MTDFEPYYHTSWRCEDGTCIKYEDLGDQHLEAIATGIFLNDQPYRLKTSLQRQVTKFKITEEIYRRLIKKMVIENKAIEHDRGFKIYYLNGECHREDGPAVEYPNGEKWWFLNDKYLKIIPQYVLENYMKANNLTLAHLLTDPDPIVRESASKYKWEEVV
jgi:hypothetical protein